MSVLEDLIRERDLQLSIKPISKKQLEADYRVYLTKRLVKKYLSNRFSKDK